MSSAPLLQIIAVGQQDTDLTTNPQITFFKQVYKRHVPFAIQTVPVMFGQRFTLGSSISVNIERLGDLVTNMTLFVKLNSLKSEGDFTWIDNLGNAMIQKIELEIGGSIVNRQYGEWVHIWNEFSQPAAKKNVYKSLIGGQSTQDGQELYIPLNFWFCRYTTLALPLIALAHHTVKVNIQTRTLGELTQFTAGCQCKVADNYNIVDSASLLVDYVYLNTEERRKIATEEHRFLIDEVQTTGTITIPKGTKQNRYSLTFAHPVKSLYWVFQDSSNRPASTGPNPDTSSFFRYHGRDAGNNEAPIAKHMQIKINGQEFTYQFGEKFFNMLQPYYRHTGGGSGTTGPIPGLYNYNFCLRPEEHQPTGTLNFSRVENAFLHVEFNDNNNENIIEAIDFRCYALNYNILLIASGMGGVLYK